MADETTPLAIPDTTPLEEEDSAEAPASRVGPPTGDTEPLPGTDAMGADTGGLAGTSR